MYIMYMRISNFKKAFTLSETLIVLTILGIVVTLTAFNTLNSSKLKEKRISATSKTFYTNVTSVYSDVLIKYTKNYSLANLNGGSSNATEYVMEAFSAYLDGDKLNNCNDLIVEESMKKYKPNTCSDFPSKIIAGFKYNEDCEADASSDDEDDGLPVIEYLELNNPLNVRNVQETCGYILYGFKNGSGTYGRDLFMIPLGKMGIK